MPAGNKMHKHNPMPGRSFVSEVTLQLFWKSQKKKKKKNSQEHKIPPFGSYQKASVFVDPPERGIWFIGVM